MSDLRQCSREFMSEFIDIYKENTCLWLVKSSEYKNRDLKRAGYDELRNKLLEVDKNASIEIVKKKINSLRSTFRAECKKVENSIKSGEEVYKPTLWYFNLLQFLQDQEMPREEIRIRKVEEWYSGAEEDTFDQTPLSDSSSPVPYSSPVSIEVIRPTYGRNYKNFNKTNINSAGSVSEREYKKLDQAKENDGCDIFGKHIACKLRKLSERDKIFTEKFINDALFHAQLGKAEYLKITFSDDE